MPTPELTWLPAPPNTWSAMLRDVGALPDLAGWNALMALTHYRLDPLATIRLDRRLQALFGDEPPPNLATKPVRLAILASTTIEHLLPALRIAALRRGIWLHIHIGEYGQFGQQLAEPSSDLHDYKPDTVLFALDAHHLLGRFDAASPDAETEFALMTDRLVHYWRLARQSFGGTIVQQTILPVFPPLFGNNEHRLTGARASLVERLNAKLRRLADAERVDLLAIDSRVAQDGIGAWFDQMLWHQAKQEVHPGAAAAYGDLFGRILAARQGRSSKCLVLDLDNTIWEG